MISKGGGGSRGEVNIKRFWVNKGKLENIIENKGILRLSWLA